MQQTSSSTESRPPVVTVPTTAETLQVCIRTVQRLIQEGHLETVRVGRCVRVTTASIEAFLARGGTAQQAVGSTLPAAAEARDARGGAR